ncbi:hypothetical protein [Massilia sp. PWRC2]|uniref:hypothetical protein n=1 Tax=Massilia sp. PWRC2 TaxID=2804626 RepID=UPI003CE78620
MKKLLATAAILSLVSVQAFAQTGAEAAAPVAPAPVAATTIAGVSVTTAVVAGVIVAAVAVAVSDSNSTTTHH